MSIFYAFIFGGIISLIAQIIYENTKIYCRLPLSVSEGETSDIDGETKKLENR